MRKFILLMLMVGIVNYASSQCTEAENPTMKKYKDLAVNSNDHSCFQCASLANLYCIAENGLYENDKAKIEKSINDTKNAIRIMEGNCCPELMNKPIKWGGSQKITNNTGSGNTASNNELQASVDQLVKGINSLERLDAIDNTYQSLKASLDDIEKAIQDNSVMSGVYEQESELHNEYNTKQKNLNSLRDVHLKIRKKMADLGYSITGEMLNIDTGLGVLGAVGAVAESATYKKESTALLDKAVNRLNTDKFNHLFRFQNKDVEFQSKLNETVLKEYFDGRTYSGNLDIFRNTDFNLIPGYYNGIKYKEFKKLFPKFGWQNTGTDYGWLIKNYGEDSMVLFKLGSEKGSYNIVGQIIQVYTSEKAYSKEVLYEFQQKVIEEIMLYTDLFNAPPFKYEHHSEDIDNEVEKAANSSTVVSWMDNEKNRLFMVGFDFSLNKNEELILSIMKVDRNMQIPVFNGIYEHYRNK